MHLRDPNADSRHRTPKSSSDILKRGDVVKFEANYEREAFKVVNTLKISYVA